MFTSGFQEAASSEMSIDGDSEAFEVLLQYIYTGELMNLTEDSVSRVLNMACFLNLAPHALQECKRSIINMIGKKVVSLQTAFEISMRPEPELYDIVKAASLYIKENFINFAGKPEFDKDTSSECLGMILDNVKQHAEHTKVCILQTLNV